MRFPKNENKNVIAVLVLLTITIITFLCFILRQELNGRTDKPLYGKFYLEKRPYHTTKVFEVHFFINSRELEVRREALKSFNELHKKAYSSLKKENLHEAILYFHRAKTICPSNFSARLKLAEVFTENCTKNNRYCGNAQREIRNAFSYSELGKQSDIEKLLYLEKIMKDYAADFFKK